MNPKLLPAAMLAMAFCLLSHSTTAQKTEPAFEIPIGNFVSKANFLIQAATGELITGNDLKLIAIDPVKKSIAWENNDFLGLDEGDIEVLDGTPFIKIERQKVTSIAKNKNTYIIQASDGKIIYDSKEEGIKVRNTLIIPALKGLLVESVKEGTLSVSFIDFTTNKQAWSVPLVKEKTGGIGIGALKRAIKSFTNSAFNVPPVSDADGNLLLVYKKEIFAISKAGNLSWKKEYDENIDDAYISTDKKALFIGYKKYIDKLNTANGNSVLKEPIKMRDELNGITPMGSDYIVYNEAGINVMDAEGNMKWKKDTKLGNISEVRFTDNGILAIEPVKDDETNFFWVDKNGEKVWDENVKGAFTLAEPTAKGVMYVTAERANILTYEKGKDVWNRDIKLKGKANFGVDENNRILYAYANEKLHAFNFKDVSYKLVAEKLELKKFNDEEEVLKFDVRKGGSTIVMSANQNVVSVEAADGKINYNNYFKDIGNTKKKWGKAIGLAAGYAGAAMNINAISKGNFTLSQSTDANGNVIANTYDVNPNDPVGNTLGSAGGDLYSAARKRYLATQATKDNLYIPSEMPEGNGMLVWNKDKGEAAKKIYFSDTTPVFVVDEATDKIYIMVGNTVKAYELK
ncbi:MAG: hypothetical protein QM791_06475 [Ferruginibacter sp.]